MYYKLSEILAESNNRCSIIRLDKPHRLLFGCTDDGVGKTLIGDVILSFMEHLLTMMLNLMLLYMFNGLNRLMMVMGLFCRLNQLFFELFSFNKFLSLFWRAATDPLMHYGRGWQDRGGGHFSFITRLPGLLLLTV